jgi:hypothetical protein
MTPCDGTPTSETWCCGTSTLCCETFPSTIPALFNNKASTLSSSTSSTAQASHSPTSTAQVLSSSTSSSLSGGAIAGTVVGAAIAVMLVIIAGLIVVRMKRTSQHLSVESTTPVCKCNEIPASWSVQDTPHAYNAEAMDSQIVEAPVGNTREIERRRRFQELP